MPAKTPHEPRRVGQKHILRAIKVRIQQRLDYEHSRARHRATFGHAAGAMADFHNHWVATGVAAMKGQSKNGCSK